MKQFISFSIVLIMTIVSYAHDMRLAHYIVHVEEGKIICDAKIDLEDLESVLNSKIDEQVATSFLAHHLTFHFDGQPIVTEVVSLERTKNWIKIRMRLDTQNTSPERLEVFNDILSEEVDGHDNLMRFVFHDKTRTFRLNNKRKKVSFYY